MSDRVRFYGEFQKAEQQDDGTIIVCGIASTESVDSVGEVIKASAMRAAIPEYMKFPAIREMHQLSAAGTALSLEVDANGVTRIEAHIVDPVAVKKVLTQTYRGFSVGGRVPPGGRSTSNPKVIESLALTEVSLVDRPMNPEAVFTMFKADADAAQKGDTPGHPFRGNQYSDGEYSGGGADREKYDSAETARTYGEHANAVRHHAKLARVFREAGDEVTARLHEHAAVQHEKMGDRPSKYTSSAARFASAEAHERQFASYGPAGLPKGRRRKAATPEITKSEETTMADPVDPKNQNGAAAAAPSEEPDGDEGQHMDPEAPSDDGDAGTQAAGAEAHQPGAASPPAPGTQHGETCTKCGGQMIAKCAKCAGADAAKAAKLEGDLKAATAEVTRLKAERDGALDERRKAAGAAAEAEARINKAEARATAAEDRAKVLEAGAKDHGSALTKAAGETTAAKQEIARLTESLRKATLRAEMADKDAKEAADALAAAKRTIEEQEQVVAKAQAATAAAEASLERQRAATTDAEQALKALRTEVESAQTGLTKAAGERDLNADRLARLAVERDQIEQDLQKVRRERDSADAEVARLKAEVEIAKDRVVKVMAERDAAEATGKRDRAKANDLDSTLVKVTGERDALQKRYAEKSAEADRLTRDVVVKRREAEVAQADLARARATIKAGEQSLTKVNAENEGLRRELRDRPKGNVRAVEIEKAADNGTRGTPDAEPEDSLDAIRKAHRSPIAVTGLPARR